MPEYDKHFPDTKTYLLEGINGANKNRLGIIIVYKSQEVKDRYYDHDGNRTEYGKSVWAKIAPVMEELNELGTVAAEYTDWVVQ